MIFILTEGRSIALVRLRDTAAFLVFSGEIGRFPVQIIWAVAFTAFASLIFNRHRFGARVRCVGDNPDSAAQMGVDAQRVHVAIFAFMGLGAALAGVYRP